MHFTTPTKSSCSHGQNSKACLAKLALKTRRALEENTVDSITMAFHSSGQRSITLFIERNQVEEGARYHCAKDAQVLYGY